ncbi:hypothetical protein D3877_27345 [Azospirillum cavernae]|uniref:Uncharacterized protein n=1 Tax=Azospirillum cavernae TaxID=2320860 RepID=A0A418VMZ3_9PROT|nr:tetratricopeptide repeat protein [Azospirillum cavernae]RJF77494.1 hypothetical protein D3877_27345 [Azospirillum cavernae]
MITVDEALSHALADHRAGRFAEAGALYRRILDGDPTNINALHLLGLIERQAGGLAGAQDGWANRIGRALQFNPSLAMAWHGLGVVFSSRGDAGLSRAIDALRRAVRLDPTLTEAHHDLGVALRRADRLDEAVDSQIRAVTLKADFVSAHMNLGNALLERGDAARAQASQRRALALSPASPECWYNLGNALHADNDAGGALTAYRRSARLGLTLAAARVATALIDLDRLAEAEVELIDSLTRPGVDVANSLELLTDIFRRSGRSGEGRALFTRLASTPLAGVLRRGECLTALAALDLHDGAPQAAVARLAAVRGDNGWFFTVKSLAALHSTLATHGLRLIRPAAMDANGRQPPRITSSTLASKGRFAHTVLEYVLLRLYAETHGCVLETPDWVGGAFFALNDPPQSGPLPPLLFPRRILNDLVSGACVRAPIVHRDILSPLFLFEHKEAYRERVQSWLKPRHVWAPHLDPMMELLRAAGATVVAIHVRRGDFLTSNYPITETAWYVDWLRALWPQLEHPVLYLASDDLPAIRHAFAEFHPLTRADVAEDWVGLEFLQDFHALMNADVVGISAASGFSLLAARLNTRARLFVEPDMAARRIRPFAPWTP